MDYEKKYKNLVAKIKNAYLYAQTDSTKAVLESIFPELAESEDERGNEEIRNFLIDMECKRERIAYLEKQKEQKPAEWSDSFEENIRNLLHDKLTWHSEDGSMSSTTFIDDKTLKDIISGIWFYVGKEALKYPNKELNVTEWSKEDESNLQSCIAKIEIDMQHWDKHGKTMVDGDIKLIDWLKSLPERFELQPKQEWSKEDEKRFISCLGRLQTEEGFPTINSTWFEEHCDKLSTWKPSEEQMEALWNTLHPDDPYYVDLSSLYDDLKKL